MKVGTGLPTARLFAVVACHAAFPLRSSPQLLSSPGLARARERLNYGNTVRLAKDLRRTMGCARTWPSFRARARALRKLDGNGKKCKRKKKNRGKNALENAENIRDVVPTSREWRSQSECKGRRKVWEI